MVVLNTRKCEISLEMDTSSSSGGIKFNESFKIVFNIDRVADGTRPDSLNLTIYNVDFDNYRTFKYDPLVNVKVLVKAGYKEQYGLIYKGDVTNIEYVKEGTENMLRITAGDGAVALKTPVAKTYSNAQASTIAEDIIKEMKASGLEIAKGAIDAIKAKLTGEKETGKTIIKESAKKALNKVLKKNGLDYGVVNNELHVVDSIKRKIPDFGVKLSGLNGLIGYPNKKRDQQTDGTFKEFITFNCLLNPDIIPGREVEIDSKYITGKFIVQDMRINGDTWSSGEWMIEAEAIASE